MLSSGSRSAGPRGCCCPSSPNISLKSSSSFPGQFAVVIGFDSSGFYPATRPSTAGAIYALLKCHNIYRLPRRRTSTLLHLAHGLLATRELRVFPSFDKSKTQVVCWLLFLWQFTGEILASTSEKVACSLCLSVSHYYFSPSPDLVNNTEALSLPAFNARYKATELSV